MMAKTVTSLDVARRAGVSQSAVSRAFTPGASIAPATVAKVKKAAMELGYRPNPIARAMITGKSRIIGLLVAYLDNQFYPQALQSLSELLQARGCHGRGNSNGRSERDAEGPKRIVDQDFAPVLADHDRAVIGETGVIRDRPGFEVDFINRASAPDGDARFDRPAVLMPAKGHWRLSWAGGSAILDPGDTALVPARTAHSVVPSMSGEAGLYRVVGTDDPPGPTWRP